MHFNFKCEPKRISLILLNIESKIVSCCETVRHVRSRYRYFRANPSGLPEVRLNICSPSSSPEHQRPSNIEPCEYWLCGKWIWVCLIDMHSQEGYFRTKTAYWILSLRLELEALACRPCCNRVSRTRTTSFRTWIVSINKVLKVSQASFTRVSQT